MKLIHYSTEPLTAVHRAIQSNNSPQHWVGKPQGLWVSVDDAWKQWCEENDFHLGRHATEIILAPTANILRIDTARDLDVLTEEYGVEPNPRIIAYRAIDWAKVAERYYGIIIAPYQYSRRLSPETFWYYSWDCASGCIWDASAIASIQPVEKETTT